jgi:ribokinase
MARKKKRARIVVVGSANVDLTTFTDQMPRPGETIFGSRFDLGFGGKGANQAVAASLCGARVHMVARVGNDLFGPATIENLERQGVNARKVKAIDDVGSGVAPIFVDSTGQNRILVVKGANDSLTPEAVENASRLLKRADLIVLQLEIPLETVYYTVRFARKNKLRVILNPAPAAPLSLEQLKGVTYLIPNETEAEAIAGRSVTTLDDAHACARELVARGFPRVILTLGERGAVLAGAESVKHVPAFPVEAVDTTGAGDAFIGSFAAFLGEGLSEEEAVERANLYAAFSTTSVGTQKSFVTRKVFDRAWRGRRKAVSASTK